MEEGFYVQEFSTFSSALQEEWLDAHDSGQLVQALKALITELFGWGGDGLETDPPSAV